MPKLDERVWVVEMLVVDRLGVLCITLVDVCVE